MTTFLSSYLSCFNFFVVTPFLGLLTKNSPPLLLPGVRMNCLWLDLDAEMRLCCSWDNGTATWTFLVPYFVVSGFIAHLEELFDCGCEIMNGEPSLLRGDYFVMTGFYGMLAC